MKIRYVALLGLAACGGNVVVDAAQGSSSASSTSSSGGGNGGAPLVGSSASGDGAGLGFTAGTSSSASSSSSSGCPQPHPEPCGVAEECSCADGTEQLAGCPNGFTCPEACCGHGGLPSMAAAGAGG